jgi:hypothetical protein
MNVFFTWLLWGFVATTVLSTVMAGSQGLKLTRMNLPFLIGSMFTARRDRAKVIGFFVHFCNGWVFALVYDAIFVALGGAGWWRGALIGIMHACFVLVAAMPILPAVHPRMASEQAGPFGLRQLEPPGFMAIHYGIRTPLSVLLAHVIYGGILGAGFVPPR